MLGRELDGCGAGDFLGERADADAVPVDDGAAGPDDVAVMQVAVGPAVWACGLVVGWSGSGVCVDERDPLVEQVDGGDVESPPAAAATVWKRRASATASSGRTIRGR
ncbi:hypothetical protein WEI85_05810 [Actinomycetes bacterium KLBMP 9797]